MGVVYRGIDEQSGAPVAIKTLQPAAFHSPKAHERFQREAGLANKLQHPGIAEIRDFGMEGDTPFLIMELVEGIELAAVIEQEAPLPPARALDIAIQLTLALAEAHRHNLIHRDIKPANIRLVSYVPGGPIQLKVLDFGIAKEIGQEKGQLTTTGAIMGTPLYLAPELLSETQAVIDGRIDQYSTGVVLYQLLTGCPPFSGQTVAAILLSHVTTPPPPLPKTVPEPLARVVLRMLKKTAKERYPNDEALLSALGECVSVCRSAQTAPRGATRPSSASLIVALPIQNQRRQNALLGLLLGLLVVGVAVLVVLLQRQTSVRTPDSPRAASASTSTSAPAPLSVPSPKQGLSSDAAVPERTGSEPVVTPGSPEPLRTKPKSKPKSKPKNDARILPKEDPFAVPLAR